MRFTIAGYPVEFPHPPYGIQFKYMEQVLKTLDAGGNALLEAPTGSGKTLALLCSALAWQQAKREGSYKATGRDMFGGSQGTGSPQSRRGNSAPVQKPYQIYYATRTHAQIAQVVDELKRTKYHPKIAILAARKHYCVNSEVIKSGRIDEACDDVVKEGTCKFFKGKWRLTTDEISNQILDIEELVSEGKQREGCPYFASRHLREQADVVFCPYTYLADPVVRTAMEISLCQAVLVLDEAHNIEDVARSGASQEVELDVLKAIQTAYAKAHYTCVGQVANGMPVANGLCQAFEVLGDSFKSLATVLEDLSAGRSGNLEPKLYEHYERVWNSQQAVELLEQAGIGSGKMMQLMEAYKLARKAHDDQMNLADGAHNFQQENADAGGMALGITSGLLSVLGMFYMPRWTSAYRLAVKKWVRRDAAKQRQHRRWVVQTDKGQWAVQLCLWCLNPAVVFSQIVEQTHSVVLTSGTLSPMDSFSSELGTKFDFRLETPHVVNMAKQVWAGAVAVGPDGQLTKCVHKEVSKLEFQDRIGKSLLRWCQVVPDGVLVFLPSYSLMDRLTGRWKETGMWKQLMEVKPLFCEPRSAGEQFDLVVDKYYKSIQSSNGGMLLGFGRN